MNKFRLLGVFVVLSALAFGLTCAEDDPITPAPGPGDPPLTASELFANRQLQEAHDAYVADVASDGNDLEARMGAAVTSLFLLPEHSAVTGLLASCGEPGLDISGLIFGPDGMFSHEILDRAVDNLSVALTYGPSTTNLGAVEFAPDRVRTRKYVDGSYQEINVELDDRSSAHNDGEVDLRFHFDLANPWANGQTFDLTSKNAPYVDLWVEQDWETFGDFWYDLQSGSVTVVNAGRNAGEAVELQLSNVTFARWRYDGEGYGNIDAYYVLNGAVTDTIFEDFEPDESEVPFADLEFEEGPPQRSEIIQILETCNPKISIPRLLVTLNQLMTEVDAIRAHLDAIANSPNASSFRWEVPVGAIANTRAIPVGITEVHLARAILLMARASNDFLQEYHWIDADVSQWISTFTRYEWDGPVQVRDIDLHLVAPLLNSDFLQPVGSLDMTGFRTDLTSALQAVKSALNATPTGNTLLNFQASGSQAAAAELSGFVDDIIGATTAPYTDGTGNFTFDLSAFIASPFDQASLRSDTGIGAGPLWILTERNASSQTNADLEPDEALLEEIINTFVSFPEGPNSNIYCVDNGPCTAAAPMDEVWACNGWDGDNGVCSEDMVTPCSPYGMSTCSGYCVTDICAVADPDLFDTEVVEQAFDADPPPFVNQSVLEDLEAAF